LIEAGTRAASEVVLPVALGVAVVEAAAVELELDDELHPAIAASKAADAAAAAYRFFIVISSYSVQASRHGVR
jgi:hypothetical protein